MYNPLLETNVRDRTWYDIAEDLQNRILWAARKKRDQEAFKLLNVLDLIDSEASAYWHDLGIGIYSGSSIQRNANPARATVSDGMPVSIL